MISASSECKTEALDVRLAPLTAHQFPAWIERASAEYIDDLVGIGQSTEAARESTAATMERTFPGGVMGGEHVVFDVVGQVSGADAVVGYLWIGPDSSSDAGAWWVWDITLSPDFRGQGIGRQVMLLAETFAAGRGATTLGLNVFGSNAVARGLYESLGYTTTKLQMRKELS